MTRKPDDWMPLHIGDYFADTTNLTRDQHGAYLLLIMAYWRRGESLPDDDGQLAAMAKATPQEWRKMKPIIAPFFIIGDGRWKQKRCEEELEKARALMAAKSKAGKKGAEKRWHNDGNAIGTGNGTAMADASDSQWQTDAPLPTTLVPVSEEAKASSGAGGAVVVSLTPREPPAWWPKVDRYGRVESEVTDKILYDVGKVILGNKGGGQITKLKSCKKYSYVEMVELLLEAEKKADPKGWWAAVVNDACRDDFTLTPSEKYPRHSY